MNIKLIISKKNINLKCNNELLIDINKFCDRSDEITENKINRLAKSIILFFNSSFFLQINKKNIDNTTTTKSEANLLKIIEIGNNKTK